MEYDDVFISSVVEPAISTIHIRKRHAGIEAAKLLMERIDNPGEIEHPWESKWTAGLWYENQQWQMPPKTGYWPIGRAVRGEYCWLEGARVSLLFCFTPPYSPNPFPAPLMSASRSDPLTQKPRPKKRFFVNCV